SRAVVVIASPFEESATHGGGERCHANANPSASAAAEVVSGCYWMRNNPQTAAVKRTSLSRDRWQVGRRTWSRRADRRLRGRAVVQIEFNASAPEASSADSEVARV